MSWYTKNLNKTALKFEDRNTLNHQIAFFKDVSITLEKLSQVIFQDAKYAKTTNFKILNDKKVSSFPVLRDMLIQAYSIALDSPWKFAEICKTAAEKFKIKSIELTRERDNFHIKDKKNPLNLKGWVD